MKKLLSVVLSLITLLCVAALCACNVTFKGSPSASPAASDGKAGDKSGQDSSSTDVSALMAEIESLQARIDELEADVGYLEKAGFNGAGTLYYNAQDFASNAFRSSHKTRGLGAYSVYATTYPTDYKYRITDEAQFKEDFPNFPEEVDFDKEAVVVYCFTDKHSTCVYELSQISVDGEIIIIDINRVTVKNYIDKLEKQQHIFLIRMSNVLDYDINITFGVRYTDYEEVAKIAADEYSKSELKENSAWQNRIDQLRKTVERLEVENELLQVELDAYRYHLRSSDYRGTRAQWMDDVVSGRIDVSGNPYLEEKEYWDENSNISNPYYVLVTIDKNFAEKEFTVDDFKQYFTVYDVSDTSSYVEKGEDGKDRFVKRCSLMVNVPFGIVPEVEEYSWGPSDRSAVVAAVKILEALPFVKSAIPSPFGMGG